MKIDKIIDTRTLKDNVLVGDLIYKFDNNIVKIVLDRNCRNYDSNIRVILIDKENIKEVELLKYNTNSLVHKNLQCYHDKHLQGIINNNNEDIARILKDIERVLQ